MLEVQNRFVGWLGTIHPAEPNARVVTAVDQRPLEHRKHLFGPPTAFPPTGASGNATLRTFNIARARKAQRLRNGATALPLHASRTARNTKILRAAARESCKAGPLESAQHPSGNRPAQ